EQTFGGALTVALFAFMMSRVDRRIGATHYTVFATLEVTGKLLAGQISGFVATGLGYSGLFLVATALAVAFLGLLPPIFRAAQPQAEDS
ncbi:MAG: MFS transporter, partial [Acidobacteriota bacterium]